MTIDISVVPVRPWLTIWTKPRETIRKIIDFDSDYQVIPLAVASGVLQALNNALGNDQFREWSLIVILALSFIGGAIGGLIGLYISSAVYSWTGSWFGGQASSEQIRPAVAWSSIPVLVFLILFLPFNLLIRLDLLSERPSPVTAVIALLLLVAILGLALVLGLWRFFLLVKCLAEVHGFSAWRALAAIISGVLVIFVPLVILVFACGQL